VEVGECGVAIAPVECGAERRTISTFFADTPAQYRATAVTGPPDCEPCPLALGVVDHFDRFSGAADSAMSGISLRGWGLVR
jgi:hypothetical protein